MSSTAEPRSFADPDSGLQVGAPVDGPTAKAPQPTTIPGRLITLVPLNIASHGRHLFEATSSGPEKYALWQYMLDGPWDDYESFHRDLLARETATDAVFFTIISNATGLPLGITGYLAIRPAAGVIEVGSVLFSPALQRTPAATEVNYLVAKHAFEDLGYRRYEWKANALNKPSLQAAERLGFTFEGIFRQHMIIKGRNRDTAWFSMLDGEWPERKAAFEKYLDPANFDEEGRQREPLGRKTA